MKWGAVLGITVLVAFIFLYEWPQLNPEHKKDKAAFIGATAIGWLLGVVLVFVPDLPSFMQLLEYIFKPVSGMLEK